MPMNSVKKYQFEDYLERADAAGSVEALFKVFVDTVKLHGLDRAIFSLSTEHGDIDAAAQLGIIHNYPRDWLDYYFQNGFDRIDPVFDSCRQQGRHV
jgi:Autoinducer binding domain